MRSYEWACEGPHLQAGAGESRVVHRSIAIPMSGDPAEECKMILACTGERPSGHHVPVGRAPTCISCVTRGDTVRNLIKQSWVHVP